MNAAVFPAHKESFQLAHQDPGLGARSQYGRLVPAHQVTCPSGGAGTQVSAQQADGDARLLDGGGLLKAQSCDGLRDTTGNSVRANLWSLIISVLINTPTDWDSSAPTEVLRL